MQSSAAVIRSGTASSMNWSCFQYDVPSEVCSFVLLCAVHCKPEVLRSSEAITSHRNIISKQATRHSLHQLRAWKWKVSCCGSYQPLDWHFVVPPGTKSSASARQCSSDSSRCKCHIGIGSSAKFSHPPIPFLFS